MERSALLKMLSTACLHSVRRTSEYAAAAPNPKLVSFKYAIWNCLPQPHYYYYYYYYYYCYLLQLGFNPVAVVLTLVHTIQMFSPGGSSPYTSTHNTNEHINIHKSNNTKQIIHNYKTIHTVNTSTHIRTPYTHYKNIHCYSYIIIVILL
jgi:hypothetical protein